MTGEFWLRVAGALALAALLAPASFAADGGPPLRPSLDGPARQEAQLGAWREEAKAAQAWEEAVAASEGVLTGLSPTIVAVNLPGKGRWYRLRVRTPDSRRLCSVLAARGVDCIPVRD